MILRRPKPIRARAPVVGLATVLAMSLGLASLAQAATITVNTTVDRAPGGGCASTPGDCSLRQALAIVNADADASNTINLPASQSHYVLSLGALTISKTLTLQGGGASGTVIDGNNSSRVLSITGGLTVATTINDISITGGSVTVSGGSQGGGAIYNAGGVLTLNRDTVSNNTAQATSGCCSGGGAIFSIGGDLAINSSTLAGNSYSQSGVNGCCSGGGAVHTEAGNLSVSNSTVSGNSVSITGNGSCCNGGGGLFTRNGSLTLTSTHLDSNTATVDTTSASGCCNGGGGAYSATGALTINGGSADSNTLHWDSLAGSNGGGGLYNDASVATGLLTVSNASVSGNTATQSAGGAGCCNGGGGIFENNGSGGLSLSGVTVAGNSVAVIGAAGSDGGGGVFDNATHATPTETILNSTIEGNSLNIAGATGALGGSGYFAGQEPTSFTNVTLDNNTGNVPGGVFANGPVTLTNTALAGNSSAGNCATGGGSVTSVGHNIESGNTCNLVATGDRKNTDPRLASLQNNGGPTLTQALLVGSPAIDQGDVGHCPGTDQRGVARPDDGEGTCDIGAYENRRESPPISTVVNDTATSAAWSGSEQAGASAYDSAIVTAQNGFTPSGTVTYQLFSGNACSGSPISTQQVTLDISGGVANASATGSLGAGAYSYSASYSGDDNYLPASAACEPFAVAAAPGSGGGGTGGGSGGGTAGGGGTGGGGGGISGGATSIALAGPPKSSGNAVRFKLTCRAPAGQSCHTVEKLRTVETLKAGQPIAVSAKQKNKQRKRTIAVGSKRVSVSAGGTKSITVALNAQGRKLLKRFAGLPVTLTVQLTSGGLTIQMLSRKLMIKPARHARRNGGSNALPA